MLCFAKDWGDFITPMSSDKRAKHADFVREGKIWLTINAWDWQLDQKGCLWQRAAL